SVLAAKLAVVLALETGLADLVSRLLLQEIRMHQLRFGHLPNVAQHMSADTILQIAAPRLNLNADFRQLVSMCFDKSDIADFDVFLQHDRLEFRFTPPAIDTFQQLAGRDPDPRADDGHGFFNGPRAVLAHEDNIVRWPVVGQNSMVP